MMFVAEFVQRLHPYFQYYKKNNGIKPYMQHLICKCFNLSEDDYSEPSALRHYKGIVKNGMVVGDKICRFAKQHMKLYDVQSAAGYIKECTKDILKKEQLCQDFADVIPDICESNYPTKLAEHLGLLLQKAASEYDKQQASTKDEHSDYQNPAESDTTDSPNPLRDELNSLLEDLEKRAVKLFSNYLRFSVDYKTATPEQREKNDKTIIRNHTAFQTLNEMLPAIIRKCPDLRELKQLHTTGDCWVLSFFRPWAEPSTLQMPDGMLEYYLRLLNEAKEAVSEYFDQSSSDD
jgi:hypothetical protein